MSDEQQNKPKKNTRRRSPKQKSQPVHHATAPNAAPDNGPAPKATKVESEARTNAAFHMLLDGMTSGEIAAYARINWGITEKQGLEYVRRARKLMQEEAAEYREAAYEEHLNLRRRLRNEAWAKGKLYLVLQVAQDEAKLLGLYPAEKQEVRQTVASVDVPGADVLHSPEIADQISNLLDSIMPDKQ